MWKTAEHMFESLLADEVFSNACAKTFSVKDGTVVSTSRPIASSASSTVFGVDALDPLALESGAPFGDPPSATAERAVARLFEDVTGVLGILDMMNLLGESKVEA